MKSGKPGIVIMLGAEAKSKKGIAPIYELIVGIVTVVSVSVKVTVEQSGSSGTLVYEGGGTVYEGSPAIIN